MIDDVDMYDSDVGQFDRIVPSVGPNTGPGMPERLRVWLRARNSTVVVTTPTPHATGFSGQEIPTAWMRAADVVIRIERPDWDDSSEAGVARLTVVRNRHGPTMSITVAMLFHSSTFATIEQTGA